MKNTVDYIYSKGLYNEVKSFFGTALSYAVIKGKPLSILIYNDVQERTGVVHQFKQYTS